MELYELKQNLLELSTREMAKAEELAKLYKSLLVSEPTLEQLAEARSNLDSTNGRLEMLSDVIALLSKAGN